jgi:hypothetical protein
MAPQTRFSSAAGCFREGKILTDPICGSRRA